MPLNNRLLLKAKIYFKYNKRHRFIFLEVLTKMEKQPMTYIYLKQIKNVFLNANKLR